MIKKAFDPGVIEQIRARIDIVDEINQYVPLKRSGQNYKGVCPFHQEKSPSFMVHPERQTFRCFGCGEGGNVFTFLMNFHGQTFGEVLKELARRCGIPLVFSEKASQQERARETLRHINKEALEFFQWALKHPTYGEDARAYLEERQIPLEIQTRFGLGYALNKLTALHQHLTNKGFTRDDLEQSGLFSQYEKKTGLFDLFRHRVIFPIFDLYEEVLGFGGRTLQEKQAKYINSPETVLYQKGHHIYGLNLAKNAIRQRDQVLLVEGYVDVMTAHQYGFEQAVATLGTAMTPQQARQLIRFTPGKHVIISYDADAAGQKAADKGIHVLEEVTWGTGIQLRVLSIPGQKDPDSFLHSQGSGPFQELLDQAVPFMEYQLERILQKHPVEQSIGKAAAVQECLPMLARMQDIIYRDECLRQLAEKLNLRETSLRESLKQHSRRPGPLEGRKQTQPPASPPAQRDKTYRSEIGLLYLLVAYPPRREFLQQELQPVRFEDPVNEQLREGVLELLESGQDPTWEQLYDHFPYKEFHQRLVEITESEFLREIDYEKSLADFIRNVKLKCLNMQIAKLGQEIKSAEAMKSNQYLELMKDYTGLIKAYTRLKDMCL